MTTDPQRLLLATLAIVLWLGLIALIVLSRRATARKARSAADALATGDDPVLVAFASQTGFAEELAWMTARALSEAGTGARVTSLGDLTPDDLRATRRALFIASTTGEGDAPDGASGFVRRFMAEPASLGGLDYGVLALGDTSYAQTWAFGRALDDWLGRSDARPLFDRVEVDDGETGAIRHWQHQLAAVTGSAVAADWAPPAFDRWRLVARTHLNPGSPGGALYLLALEPIEGPARWAPGDILEVGPPSPEGGIAAAREYSIASIPADGRVEIMVRTFIRPDGQPGLASHWLTQALDIGAELPARVRTNRAFHGPEERYPLILIGNGSGLAGLRGHLRAWAEHEYPGLVWLMFGERTAAHDSLMDDELQRYLSTGQLNRLSRAFSRDPGDGRYVQQMVAQYAADVVEWVETGAYIYVCGSLEGMASGVHEALQAALGEEALQELTEAGRYRRDVY